MSESSANPTPGADPLGLGGFRAPTPEELGQTLPEFEVTRLLGKGGMAAVYEAHQAKLNRTVAIKVMAPPQGEDEFDLAARFKREAQAMAQVNHPNIAALYDFGKTDTGLRYIIMEFVDGGDLHQFIQSGKLTADHALSWLPQVCEGLAYAHEHSLVHRDIKPANILINRDGAVKIVDFGLAKLVGHKAHEMAALTIARKRLGTPDYASPETADPTVEEVDHRGDIYSVGVVAYEMLTGRVPRGSWQLPSAIKPDLDPRFDQLLSKAMQTNPNHRYQSMTEMSKALEEIRTKPGETSLSSHQGATTSPSAKAVLSSAKPSPSAKAKRSNLPTIICLAVLALAAIGSLIAFVVLR